MIQRLAVAAESARILVIDDETSNLSLLRRILERGGYTNVLTSTDAPGAEQMVAEFQADLLLLDLHMPDADGFEVLRALQPHIKGAGFPVVVLTGDGSSEARRRALSLGARDFVSKPFDGAEILLRIRNLLETRFLFGELERQNMLLETRVEERTRELRESQIEILERLARAAEFRDDDTGRHTQRVGELAAAIAAALGLGARMVDLICRAAPLHDIGKIGIPDTILLKPGELTAEETAVMRTHTVIGARILSGGQSELITVAERIALSHHERWSGGGYPNGIAGDAIPVEARIVAVADCFDALTHERRYRGAWELGTVLDFISAERGTSYDPTVVDALISKECYLGVAPVPPSPLPAVTP